MDILTLLQREDARVQEHAAAERKRVEKRDREKHFHMIDRSFGSGNRFNGAVLVMSSKFRGPEQPRQHLMLKAIKSKPVFRGKVVPPKKHAERMGVSWLFSQATSADPVAMSAFRARLVADYNASHMKSVPESARQFVAVRKPEPPAMRPDAAPIVAGIALFPAGYCDARFWTWRPGITFEQSRPVF